MRINEIFYSIQGEGIHQGEPTIFIRTQGCNLRCLYCDTKYAQDLKGGTSLTTKEVLLKIPKDHIPGLRPWVCITGGEPLLQKGLHSLVEGLQKKGYFIEVETNGSLPIPQNFWIDSWVVDIKCPSSGNSHIFTKPLTLTKKDQVKFVVSDLGDLDFTLRSMKHIEGGPKTLVSPVFPLDEGFKDLVISFCKQYGFRLSLQIHKTLWGNKKGV